MGDWQRTEWVDLVLDDLEVWAVVGLSGDTGRTAYSIAALLQRRGKRIVPIHPRFAAGDDEVLGERGYATLADVPFPVDVVDVFRRPTPPASSPTRPSPSAPGPCGTSSGSWTPTRSGVRRRRACRW